MTREFARSPVALLAAASIIAIGTSTAAYAQDTVDTEAAQGAPGAGDVADDEDAIIITGIRGSLERAMDLKRESSGVVDAVSAEDIGKFPDTNLAESLQRIPGVSISRVNGEGSQVTVRGFGPAFNLVTLNSRQMATASSTIIGGDQGVDFGRPTTRSFDFGNLAAEGVSRLEVYKTGRAAIPTGGIGATINVVTQRPLDGPTSGLRGSVGAKAVYDTSLGGLEITPEVSGLLNWSDLDDTFGVSVFGSYQKRKAEAASTTVNDWNITGVDTGRGTQSPFNNPGGPFITGTTQVSNLPATDQMVAIPNDTRYHFSKSTRERINGQLTLQFRPMDSLTLTADALYAQSKLDEERSDQTNWFNRPFNQVEFDSNPIVATTIFLQENENPVKDLGFEQQYRAIKDTLHDFGLNALWEITDSLSLNLDGHTGLSKTEPDAPNGTTSTLVSFGAPVVASHSVEFNKDGIPVQRWVMNDAVAGNGNGVLDAGDLGTQVQRTNSATQKHRLDQLQANLGWELDSEIRFDVGVGYTNAKLTSLQTSTSQTLGNWGITQPGDVAQLAGGLIETYCLACQFNHYEPGDAQIAFRGNAVDLYNAFAPAYEAMGNPISLSGSNSDTVREKIWSTYAQLSWNGELGGRSTSLIAGARWENTKVESHADIAIPSAIYWGSDNDFFQVVEAGDNGLTLTGEYNNLLPSVDFRIEPMEDVVARVSYSKTIARANYGNLFASTQANNPNRPTALGGTAGGATGTPGLKPLVSDNFDVSLEWYFGRSSYVSAAFFAKSVKNFVGIAQISQPLFELRDPSSGVPGSRSGTALEILQGNGYDLSDVNLFTMTALLIQNSGNQGAALTAFENNFSNGALNQQFVDQIAAAVDIFGDANDPFYQFGVSTPINNEKANVHGFELQGQHFFGETGFGVAGSFTHVVGDVDFDISSDPSANVFALIGLGDSYNITGIYENFGLSARLAYNWRGKYLSNLNRGGSRNPEFTEPFGTLDLNLNYEVTPNIAVSLEAINILGEPVRVHGRDEYQLWFAQELSPRILLGTRFRF